MITIVAIPAFEDNYIWLLHNQRNAIVVDPGDATPVIAMIELNALSLEAILITHHHADHIDGVMPLQQRYGTTTYAPSYGHYNFNHHNVSEGDTVNIAKLDLTFQVMWLPGHTNDHIAYLAAHWLFCGDVLFGAGCGRLFEGTPSQQLNSLHRLASLAPGTQVFCAHEYTQRNIEFACLIEPNNHELMHRQQQVIALRKLGKPSLPSTIEVEQRTNPFLRCTQLAGTPSVPNNLTSELDIFTHLRMLRNHF